MKKIILLLLSITVLFWGCNDSEISNGVNTLNQRVLFVTQLKDVSVSASKSQAGFDPVSNVPYVAKFVFYAFRENASGVYVLEKIVKDTSDEQALLGNDEIWSTDDESSLLPVGKYKFISLYNLGVVGENGGLREEIPLGTRLDVAKAMVFEHTDNGNDINEVFCGIKETPTSIGADNEAVVAIELSRIVSRIDVKFIKLSADGSVEIPYGNNNTIFGETVASVSNINGISMALNGLPSALSFDKTSNGSDKLDCTYEALLAEKLVFGKSAASSSFPGTDTNFDASSTFIADGIIAGGAYLKGAYVLPFVSGTDKMNSIILTLQPTDQSKYGSRTITINTSGALALQSNYVTLITVKLISTTDPLHPETGDDNEHLFNPKTRLTVSIDTKWGGCIDVPVEVH